jgi:ABC-type Fe3+-siderophore transport system permease subunit
VTPLPPPPRLVRATHAKPVLIAVVYLLLAAALAGTLFFVGVIANELALRWLGHDVDATV